MSAAPGVDHAAVIGILVIIPKTMPATPIAMAPAINPLEACSGLAPTAIRPPTTTANELANPTTEAISPIKKACHVKSLNMMRVLRFRQKGSTRFV
jgi:hypothetical protein